MADNKPPPPPKKNNNNKAHILSKNHTRKLLCFLNGGFSRTAPKRLPPCLESISKVANQEKKNTAEKVKKLKFNIKYLPNPPLPLYNLRTISPFTKTWAEDAKHSNACPWLLCFSSRNKMVGKEHLVNNFIDDPIKQTHVVLYYKQNEWPALSSAGWFAEVLTPRQSLPSTKEAVDDPQQHLVEFSFVTLQILEGGCSWPNMVQSTKATRHGMCWYV